MCVVVLQVVGPAFAAPADLPEVSDLAATVALLARCRARFALLMLLLPTITARCGLLLLLMRLLAALTTAASAPGSAPATSVAASLMLRWL